MLGLKDKARGALLCDSVRGGKLCIQFKMLYAGQWSFDWLNDWFPVINKSVML